MKSHDLNNEILKTKRKKSEVGNEIIDEDTTGASRMDFEKEREVWKDK